MPVGVHYFATRIWGTREGYGRFEGVGSPGLTWLSRAREETRLATMTEVSTSRQVESALEVGVDAIWLGARTTASARAVKEIARALAGATVQVFVENPNEPDVGPWLEAIQRLGASGQRRLAAIHRGFATRDHSRFRSRPMWELVVDLRRSAQHLPVLCNPSCIASDKSEIADIAQLALDGGAAGLMVEAHASPSRAQRGAGLQITPERLDAMLRGLEARARRAEDPAVDEALGDLRRRIDRADEDLLRALAARSEVVERIASLKREKNIAPLQMGRWQQVLSDRLQRADSLGLSQGFVRELYEAIHEESLRLQSSLIRRPGGKR